MSDKDPGNGAGKGGLEVFGEPSAPTEPGKGALDHPAARQHFEPPDGVGALDDLDRPAAGSGQFQPQLVAGIAAIGEDMAQPGIEISNRGEDADGAIAILNVGGMDLQPDQVAERVDDDVALAALDLLTGIIPSRTAAFRGLERLAVDHASARAGFAPDLLARGHNQHMVDLGQRAVARPAVEIALDRRIRGKILRYLPPLATGRGHVKQRLHHCAQIGFAWSSNRPPRRHQRRGGRLDDHAKPICAQWWRRCFTWPRPVASGGRYRRIFPLIRRSRAISTAGRATARWPRSTMCWLWPRAKRSGAKPARALA